MTISKYIFVLLIAFSSSLFSQTTEVSFVNDIENLNNLGKEILGGETDEKKYNANKKHTSILKDIINKSGSFDYDFNSLKSISVLQAHNLKIYNWTLPLTDGSFEYFAFLQIRKSKSEFLIIELTDKSDQIKAPENKILTSKNWYGALYHKVIYDKKLGQNYYTLLGWDGNNNLTNKKIIDIVNISKSGVVKFGGSIFKTEKRTKKRMIFEYAEDAIMSLKYYPESGKIIFNQLDPMSNNLKGVHEYYIPNLKYFDALIIKNKKWQIEKNTNITLDRSIKDKYWKDPEK